MRIERLFTDGNGHSFRAVVDIDESGPSLERAVLRLANKARGCPSQRASALGGVVRVVVHPVIENARQS